MASPSTERSAFPNILSSNRVHPSLDPLRANNDSGAVLNRVWEGPCESCDEGGKGGVGVMECPVVKCDESVLPLWQIINKKTIKKSVYWCVYCLDYRGFPSSHSSFFINIHKKHQEEWLRAIEYGTNRRVDEGT